MSELNLNVAFFVDDTPSNTLDAEKHGFTTLLMPRPWNDRWTGKPEFNAVTGPLLKLVE